MTTYPSDWKVVKLGEVGDVAMCRRVLKSQTMESGDVPFFKIGTFGRAPDAYISHDLYESLRGAYSFPKCGDVLVSAAGTIGRTVVYDGEDAYYQDSNIVWIENDESKVLNSYLYWWYKVIEWKTENGGTVDRLYNKNFLSSSIAYPPLPEQKRIAGVLGDMDKLIENLGKRIEKKRQIKKGAMQELLTGKKRLSGFTGEWVEKSLGELVDCLRGVSYDGNDDIFPSENENTIRLLRSNNIQESCFVDEDVQYVNRLRASAIQVLRQYDIMVCMANGSKELVGKTCLFRKPFCTEYTFGAFMGCVRAKEGDVCMEYVFQLMNSYSYSQQISLALAGSSINNLRPSHLLKMRFFMPPSVPEQRAIAAVLSDMDAEIANLERRQEKLKQVKKGMLQDLLTGKVRLKGQGGAT